jgi:hypothetical protein
VLELGTATGFDVRLVDRAGLGHETLMGARNQLLGMSMLKVVLPIAISTIPAIPIALWWARRSNPMNPPILQFH